MLSNNPRAIKSRERRARNPEAIRAEARRSYARYKSRRRAYMNEWYANKRTEVIEHYGGRCVCCGETEEKFLTIEHINGGGNKHRKQISGAAFWSWIIKAGFPDYLTVLCYNCNLSKAHHKSCPHEDMRSRAEYAPY